MQQPSTPLLHTIDNAKNMLGCGRNAIYNMVSDNHLTLVKMGRRSMITDQSIRALVDRKIEEAQSRAHLEDVGSAKARAGKVAKREAGAAINEQAKESFETVSL